MDLGERSTTTKHYKNMKKGEKDTAQPSLYSSVQPWSSTCKIRGEKASECRHSLSSGIERVLLEPLNTDLEGGIGVLDCSCLSFPRTGHSCHCKIRVDVAISCCQELAWPHLACF